MLSVLSVFALFSLVLPACTDSDHQATAAACTEDCKWTEGTANCNAPTPPSACVVEGEGCTPTVGCTYTAANPGLCQGAGAPTDCNTRVNQGDCVPAGGSGGCKWVQPTVGTCTAQVCNVNADNGCVNADLTTDGCTSTPGPITCEHVVCVGLSTDDCNDASDACKLEGDNCVAKTDIVCTLDGDGENCDAASTSSGECEIKTGQATCAATGGCPTGSGNTETACTTVNCLFTANPGNCEAEPDSCTGASPCETPCTLVGQSPATCVVAAGPDCTATGACSDTQVTNGCVSGSTAGSCTDESLARTVSVSLLTSVILLVLLFLI